MKKIILAAIFFLAPFSAFASTTQNFAGATAWYGGETWGTYTGSNASFAATGSFFAGDPVGTVLTLSCANSAPIFASDQWYYMASNQGGGGLNATQVSSSKISFLVTPYINDPGLGVIYNNTTPGDVCSGTGIVISDVQAIVAPPVVPSMAIDFWHLSTKTGTSTGTTTMLASVAAGVQTTGTNIWPILAVVGVPLAFAIAIMLVDFLNSNVEGAGTKKKTQTGYYKGGKRMQDQKLGEMEHDIETKGMWP